MSNNTTLGTAIAGTHTGIDHAYDANTYTINNTATQTLNAVRVGAQTQNHSVIFHGPNGKEVGRFDFNGDELRFDGSADISAQVFIEWASRAFRERLINEKLDVFKKVQDALLHESTGALYEDAEKLAILTCLQRVQEIRQSVEPPQEKTDYTTSMAKSMAATKNAVATSIIGSVFGGQP
jgi:hypothetical protein